jgi:DNA-binding transcriptional regulator PaaX
MSEKEKIKLAKEILVDILNSASDFMEFLGDMTVYQRALLEGGRGYVAAIKNKERRKRIHDELARLKKEKFIEKRKIGGKLIFCLTNKGRAAALRHKMTRKKKILTDGYCLVIFDVPESERRVRNFFRTFLKESGFKQLQQSVWFTKDDISEDVIQLVRDADAEKWIRVIVAKSISNLP